MNHHELLDMIGEVNETYVLAADQPVKRVRSRWQTWAACAACAALMIGAYPAYRALQPKQPPLHSYTVVEDGGGAVLTEQGGTVKAPFSAGTGKTPAPDIPMDPDGSNYTEPNQGPMDLPANQDAAQYQYDNLMKNGGISYAEGGSFPEWYGGAWLDNDWPDKTARLTVAIVESFRTPEMEAQILEWCGGTGDVLFTSTKYPYAYLQDMMERMNQDASLEAAWKGASGGYGIDVTANCIGVDVFAERAPEELLAKLAEFDPDGDAIRVEVHAGQTINTDLVKGPAPGGAQDDQPADAPDEATDTPESAMPAATENSLLQAKYDLLPLPDGENG